MIKILAGCMRSGKTDTLLKIYNITKDNKKHNTLLVKSFFDRQKLYVKSRSGLKSLADLVLKPNEIGVIDSVIKEKKITDVFIDEVQFFDYDIVYLVQNNYHINFYLSGLEYDYKRRPFGFLNVIKQICKHDYIWHDMPCENCQQFEAKHSFKTTDNEEIIDVGDLEYMSVCDYCYDLLLENRRTLWKY
jgi:thymidine kinase